MTVDYNHQNNLHTLQGPRRAFPALFPKHFPHSILDVGCGTGTWLRSALEFGVRDVTGVDGVLIAPENLLFDPRLFLVRDLTKPLDLYRTFDVVLCLEVAEHLDEQVASTLLDSLTRHSSCVVFSAACPNQPGQHHVNCQWPAYWQALFNARGYACEDSIRWHIWDEPEIEPWYRQNLFIARHNPQIAGREPRIKAVVHPDIAEFQARAFRPDIFPDHLAVAPVRQYPRLFARAMWSKIANRISRM